MTSKKLVCALKDGHVGGQLGSGRTLSAAIRSVVAAAGFAVAKPVQHPETVGVQGKEGSCAGEQLDSLPAGPADAGVVAPRRPSDGQLGAAAQPLDPVGRPWTRDDRRKFCLTGRED